MPDYRSADPERRFRRLLRLLPFDFRREFGEEMTAVFRDEYTATTQEGSSAVARLWIRTTVSLARLARREHLASLRGDVAYALRLLRRAPGFTVAATASLALGIGANAAVFGLARAVLIDPLPIPDPATAVSVYVTDAQNPGVTPLSTDNFRDVRDQSTALMGVSAFTFVGVRARLTGEPENLFGMVVSGDYFRTLGIRPHAGRLLGPEDDAAPGRSAVVVLTHALWTRAFSADPAVVGRAVSLTDRVFTVVGVSPPDFHGTFGLAQPDLFLPLSMYDTVRPGTPWSQGRRWRWLNVVARLAPGVALADARAATRLIGDRLAQQHPEFNRDRSLTILPLSHSVMGADQYDTLTRAGWMLAGLVCALLLIACTNLGNLLLARNTARAKEIAVRLALGASRGRIVRQLVTESVVLALAGGALGLALMTGLYGWLWAARPPAFDQLTIRPGVDATVVLFTLAVSLLTALLFGLAPAVRVVRTDLSRSIGAGRELAAAVRPRIRAALVTGQVGLATVALVAAGLFLRSLWRAEAIDPGFAHERLLAVNYSAENATSADHARQLHEETLARARALPGVAAAALTDRLPLSQGTANTIDIPGATEGEGTGVLVPLAEISPGYFRTTGIALVAGRDFGPDDRRGTPPVAIVTRTMADRFWPEGDAVGRRFRVRVDGSSVEVVGVVDDSPVLTIGEAPQPFMYRPLWQRAALGQPFQWLVVSSPSPDGLSSSVRALMRELYPDAPANDPVVVSARLDEALWAPRMLATLVAGFGGVALALAGAGIYGLLAVTVAQRRQEFGIRMTFGARPRQVLGLVLRGGMTWVVTGLALGVGGGLVVARWTRSLRYTADGVDAGAMAGAAALLLAVALAACVIPARRAAKTLPSDVLRS